jgi:uncharacterized membrane protein YqiK
VTILVTILVVAVVGLVAILCLFIGFTAGVMAEKDSRAGEETDPKFDPEFHRTDLSLYDQERQVRLW